MTEDSKKQDETVAEDSTAPASEAPSSATDGEVEEVEIAELDPLEAAQADAASMKDKWMRTAADFDNYRKRSRREVSDAEKKGRDSLLKDILPVFDNLERATAHAETTSDSNGDASVKGLVDGITLVMKQFRDALSRLGIERVESVGQPFDPGVHEAIQHLETGEYQPGCVAAEVQPGYRQGDRLVRPALVVVAKAPSSDEPVTSEPGTEELDETPSADEASEQESTPSAESH